MLAPKHTQPDKDTLERLIETSKWQLRSKHVVADVIRSGVSTTGCVPCGGTADESSSELFKEFKFRNFKEAFAFMTAVADKAEQMNHHPEWSNVYNRVNVALTTHSANSTVTSLDVELAEACEDAKQYIVAQRPPKPARA